MPSKPDLPDGMVWYFAYASSMNLAVFRKQLDEPSAVFKACSAVAQDAWLSFDYCGLPYAEPAYVSLIISGVNDGPFKGKGKEKEATEEFKHYIHDRCYPGITYENHDGILPPHAEGVLYQITPEQLQRLQSTSGFRMVQLDCQRFLNADKAKKLGSPVTASTLIAKEEYRSSRLMPTLRIFASVYRPAITVPLSVEYCRYLVHLRPYNVEHGGRSAQLARKLFLPTVLIPLYLILYAPIVLLQRWVLGRRLYRTTEAIKLHVADAIRSMAMLIERLVFKTIFGDFAYAIDEN